MISSTDSYFFVLLKAGLGLNQSATSLSGNDIDWAGIYTLATQQTVTGIIADGITMLGLQDHMPEPLLNQFITDISHITQANIRLLKVQSSVCQLFEDKSLPYVILKGQGVAQNYPNPLHRICGDIDYYLDPADYENAKSLLTPIGTDPIDKPLSGEFTINLNNVEVELHNNINAHVNSHCVKFFPHITQKLIKDSRRAGTYNIPSANFDAIYLFIHTVRHLGAFGISLRQVADWAMHMQAHSDEIDQQWLDETIDNLHLRNLWTLFTAFAHEYLGLSIVATHPESDRLWQVIKSSGNFGCLNGYNTRHYRTHLHERLYRTHYLLLQARQIKQFDLEFGSYLQSEAVRDFFASILRLCNR